MFKILADNPLLGDFPPELLEKMAAISEHETYKAGETVFNEGDPGNGIYLIQSGEALVENRVSNDEIKVLGILDEGDIFGEMALFDGEPRCSTIKARTDLAVVKISNQNFFRLIQDEPADASKILIRIIVELTQTLRKADRQLLTYYEAGKIIASEHSLQPLTVSILELLTRMIHQTDGGLFGVWNIYNLEFDIMAESGFSTEQLADFDFSPEHPIHQKLRDQLKLPLNEREALLLEIAEFPQLADLGVSSLIIAPVAFQDKFLGFILLANFKESGVFAKPDLNLLMGVAGQMGGAVDAAWLRAEEEGRRRLEKKRGWQ